MSRGISAPFDSEKFDKKSRKGENRKKWEILIQEKEEIANIGKMRENLEEKVTLGWFFHFSLPPPPPDKWGWLRYWILIMLIDIFRNINMNDILQPDLNILMKLSS